MIYALLGDLSFPLGVWAHLHPIDDYFVNAGYALNDHSETNVQSARMVINVPIDMGQAWIVTI